MEVVASQIYNQLLFVSGEFFARLVHNGPADAVHQPELDHQELGQPPLQGELESEGEGRIGFKQIGQQKNSQSYTTRSLALSTCELLQSEGFQNLES